MVSDYCVYPTKALCRVRISQSIGHCGTEMIDKVVLGATKEI